MVREMLTAQRQFVREPGRQFLPRDPRPQAHHGEDHAGVSGRPHGVRAVPRPSLRALDAEPVLRNVGVLLRPSASGPVTKWAKRSSTTGAHDYDMKHPKDGRVMNPKFILPATYVGTGAIASRRCNRRMAYAEWLTARDNPFFAKSTANRVWSYFFGRGHHRPGGRHPRFQSAQQSGAARCADEGFHGPRFRPAPPDAHHRQLARLPGIHRDQRMERKGRRQLLARHAAAVERGGTDGRAGAGHGRAAGLPGGAAGHARRAVGRSARRQGRIPGPVRPAGARIVVRMRAPQRPEPAAGAEPGQRQDHFRRRGGRQRAHRQSHSERPHRIARWWRNCIWRR